jgi:putative peptidoglycan lipid II flippase
MVKRVLQLMYSEIRGLHQAAYILALFAFGSQMLALVRDRLLAHSFGAGGELDLYYAAFRIPDLLFVLFGSVLSVYVLLPFVTQAREARGDKAGAEVLGQMFSVFLLCYVSIAAILFVIVPYLVPIFFPGLMAYGDTLVVLIRILLLQPFLLGISSLFGVVTQLSHRFILYAISPLIYNLGIIIGITLLYPFFGMAGLAMGVVIGALGHMLVQYPLVSKSEFAFKFDKVFDWKLLRSVFVVAVPRALTLSVHQVVLLVFIGVATTMVVGSVSVFQFAFNLQSVPLAIIGMSYSVAAFPVLADLFAKKDSLAFNMHVMTALRHIIFWSFPIIALVVVLRAQIVRVVLGSGAFDWDDTRLTAAVLALFIIALTAQSILLLLVRTFYAGGKTRTPLIIALVGALVSVVCAYIGLHFAAAYPHLMDSLDVLFRLEGVEGTEVLILALAFIVGVLVEMCILLYMTIRVFGLRFERVLEQLCESLLAALVAALTSYATLIFIVDGINQETFIGILLQGAVAAIVGVAGALLTYYILGSAELREIYRSYHSKIFKTDVIGPQPDTL